MSSTFKHTNTPCHFKGKLTVYVSKIFIKPIHTEKNYVFHYNEIHPSTILTKATVPKLQLSKNLFLKKSMGKVPHVIIFPNSTVYPMFHTHFPPERKK